MTKARSNAVANAAKGDLTVGSGTNLSGVLGVGSNGDTIVADSSTATGLRYQGSQAAGKNAVINGAMDIWQRGTSFAIAGVIYGADRWMPYSTNTGRTCSRQTAGLAGFTYCNRIQRNASDAQTASVNLYTSWESIQVVGFQGQNVTLSFYVRAGANFSAASSILNAQITTGTGTDGNIPGTGFTGQASPGNTNFTLTTSWQRFTMTTAIGTSISQLGLQIGFTPVGTAGAADYFEITGVQLEIGSVATTFTRAGGTLQGELAACQRYYYRSSDSSTNFAPFVSAAITSNSTQSDCYIPLPVTMRTKLASVDFANLSIYDYVAGSGYTISNAVINSNSSPTMAVITITFATATAGRFIIVRGNNSSSAYLGFSAEL